MEKISTSISAPKTLTVAKKLDYKYFDNFSKMILLENISDPGNLGTIIRTSCAFGVDAIVLYGDTVDLYNPKCVRASVGNLWKVPIYSYSSIEDIKTLFSDFSRVATLPMSDKTILLNDYKQPEKVLIMFGTESTGLSNELKDIATENVTIEMTDKVESLNLSISAGVILYKLYKN